MKLWPKSRRQRWLVAIVVAAIAISAATLLRPNEPSYGGHTVTEWVERAMYDEDKLFKHSRATEDAIWAMGTNAVPSLIRNLQRRETWWTLNYGRTRHKLPSSIQKSLPQMESSFRYRQTAALLLRLLGSDAAPALPALMDAAKYDRLHGTLAILTIGHLGQSATNAIPLLRELAAEGPPMGLQANLALRLIQDPEFLQANSPRRKAADEVLPKFNPQDDKKVAPIDESPILAPSIRY